MDLPELFRERMKSLLGEEYASFENALTTDAPVSIRLNETKSRRMPSLERVPWASSGFYLSSRPSFTMDPCFHAGVYYVQEASSMFLEQAFRQHLQVDQPLVLDLCAAPGGKSTHLASLLSGKGLLVSNEVIRARVKILAENMTKWGAPNVVVTNNDPSDFSRLRGFFDMVVVDAPCSGEGMFRKDAASIAEWSVENVKLCSERQRRIVADIYPSLKEGGLLVYSTCTYNREEDEENVRWMVDELGTELLPLDVPAAWNIASEGLGYHFFPHRTKGEGFFLALLRKSDDSGSFKTKVKQTASSSKIPAVFNDWLNAASDFQVSARNDTFYALPKGMAHLAAILESELQVVQAGIVLGKVKGKDVLPDTALAFSSLICEEAFETVDLSWKEAIDFLRREQVLFQNSAKGWVLVRFDGHPLGFAKNLGSRANNTYPQEWRIRMEADESRYEPIWRD
ncbi:MAG: rRNA cytosine-C5-methyltransferase [Paludibacteraceae bacterium]|nr:rRNA cytosine-C5-methyltransferase [Paludibacteraceae bacterium]